MEQKKYYIGLDMGTSSVGWAVTDVRYELLRRKGKDMWGVRLFKEAETAAGRRTNRVARRRLEREHVRNGYLRELFAEEIAKVDVGFYQRLEDSKYYPEDKSDMQKFSLFNDKDFTDKEYYKQYPTVFHLRKELIESNKPHDVRLVFLAVLNIFKHRGHFLNNSLSDEGIGNLNELYSELKSAYRECFDKELYSEENTLWLEEILSSKQYSRSEKHKQILNKIGITSKSDKAQAELWKLVCGLSGTLSVVFENDTIEEEKQKVSISFTDGNFDEKCMEAESLLSESSYELFLVLKGIHDWAVLANIMKGDGETYEYLSFARVALYEKHKKDLELLKKIYHMYLPEKYNAMFRVMEKDNYNYSAYVGSVNSKKQKVRRGAKNKADDFLKEIKKSIESIPDCSEKDYILAEIEKGTFLPKQLTSANGVIPNQVHKRELKAILAKAENYLPFLKVCDESGLSVSERIVQVFEFQIPYYIGPIAPYVGFVPKNQNMWSVRKENGKVYPWNFEEKIDTKQSAEQFIHKMVNHCTYLSGEYVLPKNSLLYEKYMVLNELNNLQVNGEKLSIEWKQQLYKELFQKGKKVTKKKLVDYLKINGIIAVTEEADISGIDGDFTNTCANYAKFAQAFGTDTLTYQQIKMAEDIIYWSTIYGDTKKFLKQKIEEAYGNELSQEFIKRILGIKFKDWGRLSKGLLLLEGKDVVTNESKTVISRMWEENYNLMELIATDKFTYAEAIKEKQISLEKTLFEVEYEDLDELYVSAPVKRMIWQTISILKEIVGVMGCEPEKIFVEMARNPEDVKERKSSRKKKFLELYKNCKEEGYNWTEAINATDESKFRSKKLYLYYTQKGKCMYTGERIELEDLFNDNLYDIDHIYPRHFVKDDSIENNLVLVKKEKNAHKTDNYPLEAEVKQKCISLWNMLRDGKFITEEKYKRLTRTTEFTDEERADFIARQLVETRQGTKVITDIFKHTFPQSDIIYSKASNVSAFRNKFDLHKCRIVNDFHHANDAYLNIVVGNVYNVKFTKNPINFIREYKRDPERHKYHMDKMFEFNVERNGELAWNVKNDKSISIVKRMMKKNTPLVTRMVRSVHGGLFDQNIVGKEKTAKGKGYTPIKSEDVRLQNVNRYGGYSDAKGMYFFVVEYMNSKKKERVRTIEQMLTYKNINPKDEAALIQYCEKQLGYQEVRIVYTPIPFYSLIKVNGFYLYLTGRSDNRLTVCNATQLVLEEKWTEYIRVLNNSIEKALDEKRMEAIGITKEANLGLYDELTIKHTKEIYAKRPNSVGEKMVNKREKFTQLNLEKQRYVLLQILSLSQQINQGADLTDLDEAKGVGKSKVNKKISETEEFKLICQSAAGLYTKQIDLLTV